MAPETALLWVLVLNGIVIARWLWHSAPAIRNGFILAETQAQLNLVLIELEALRNEHHRNSADAAGGEEHQRPYEDGAAGD